MSVPWRASNDPVGADSAIMSALPNPGAGERRVAAGHVLLADDQESVAVLVHALLSEYEIDVDWASDHDAAIEAIRGNCYDAILIDYNLGLTNGIKLMTELAIRGYDAPMLLLTGSSDPAVDAAAMRAGAANFLSKSDLSGPGLDRAIRYARERHRDLSNARSHADSMLQQASTDPMTGLGNRRAFDIDIARLVDGDGRGALLMIDMDNLKLLNDKLGHAAGDLGLQTIAERIRETVRGGDAAYRVGGDEFAVILLGPGTEVIGSRLAVILGRVAGPDGMISASVGWAERQLDDTPAALVQRADADLYANKRLRHPDAS